MLGMQMTRMPNAVIGISLLNRLTPGTILRLGVSVIMGTIHSGNNILPQRNSSFSSFINPLLVKFLAFGHVTK